MKPLSIEEIKQMKLGDWIYLCIDTDDKSYGKVFASTDIKLIVGSIEFPTIKLEYKYYGKTWLAYKNKEQAECKGELIELPRIIHPNELEYFVQYQYSGGIIQYEIFYALEKAEQKLKELRNIDG